MRSFAAVPVLATCALWRQACPPAVALARAAARRALRRGASAAGLALPARVEIGITLADDTRLQRLNRDWRGCDRPTNVLAFPAWTPGESVAAEVPLLLGDVVLALETIGREACAQHKPFADHLRHLTVHGVLHLLGYDHLSPRDAAAMQRLESAILAGLGVPDPYRNPIEERMLAAR